MKPDEYKLGHSGDWRRHRRHQRGCQAGADASVIVLETESMIGHHSSGRSAAIFIRNYGNATLRALNAASAPFLAEPQGVCDSPACSRREVNCCWRPKPIFPNSMTISMAATGLERLSAAQALELVPILREDAIAAAAIEWDAQDIDVDRMLQGFARRLRGHGGRIVTGAPVHVDFPKATVAGRLSRQQENSARPW
jgi:D-arginine dehydrogenase